MISKPSKVLIIAPAWVGDMVMAQTVFKLLKANNPQVELDLVAPPATYALASRMPEIHKAFKLQAGHGGMQWQARYQMGKLLRSENYDQAIVLTNSWKSALIPFFAGIKKRTGWRGEMRYVLLNDVRILDKEKLPLMIQRFCALGLPKDAPMPEVLPWPRLVVDAENQKNLLVKFPEINLNKKVLALCPGAEYGPAKRWLPEYFAEVAKHYLAQDWQVWILGGPKDQELADQILQQTQNACLSFVGKTSLPDAIDLLALTQAVVTNDSGLMHIAAALERPMAVIYGSTSPKFTPPLSDVVKILQEKLPCSPCFERTCPLKHYHCLTELKPARVIQELDLLLQV